VKAGGIKVDKKNFVKAIRQWDSQTVAGALAKDRSLAGAVDQLGKTALHHCAEIDPQKSGLKVDKSLATARALIDARADVNAIRVIMDDGEEFMATPLWYAVAWGKNPDLVRLLLDSGARPDQNAIGSAIWEQDLVSAELLRSHGGDIDHDSHGETPLLRCVKSRRLKLLSWLTENGANINFRDPKGYTPLHYAVRGAHTLAQIEELLRHGAKPDIKAKDGSTPISLAQAAGKHRLAALLESFGS
jgi:ankyrin repeat protein